MKQSIQHEKLFLERVLFSDLLHLLIVEEGDSESVRSSCLCMVRSLVSDDAAAAVVVVVIDERRSKFSETKQILS